MSDSQCSCDFSYTCSNCQTKIDVRNQAEYTKELRDWTVESIQRLAKKLMVVLPDPPEERGF